MKVIKPGVLPTELRLRGTCTHCGCEVEFKTGEAQRHTHRNETYYSVPCPTKECGRSISVEV